jgi:hypothetical protein
VLEPSQVGMCLGCSAISPMTDGAAVCWRGISRTYLAGRGVAGGDRQIGGAFVIAIAAGLVGLLCYWYCRVRDPSFFRGETLSRATPTLVPDE